MSPGELFIYSFIFFGAIAALRRFFRRRRKAKEVEKIANEFFDDLLGQMGNGGEHE